MQWNDLSTFGRGLLRNISVKSLTSGNWPRRRCHLKQLLTTDGRVESVGRLIRVQETNSGGYEGIKYIFSVNSI